MPDRLWLPPETRNKQRKAVRTHNPTHRRSFPGSVGSPSVLKARILDRGVEHKGTKVKKGGKIIWQTPSSHRDLFTGTKFLIAGIRGFRNVFYSFIEVLLFYDVASIRSFFG